MKSFAKFVLASTMAVSLAACGGSSANEPANEPVANDGSIAVAIDEPITIEFWECLDNETYDADVQSVVDKFNETIGKENNITVNMTVASGGIEALEANLVAAIKAGKGVPNVITTEATYVPEYLMAGAVVDLTPYVNDAEYGLDLDDYYPFFVENSTSYTEPGFYTLPGFVSGEVLYYNVEFFNENGLTVPTTWDELEETAAKITEITGKPCFGWDDPLKMFTTLSTEAGAGYTDAQGNILFGGDNLNKAIDAVSWYKGCIDKGIFRTAGADYYFSGPFGRNEVQMYIGSGNEAQWIQYKFPEGGEFEWACAPIPHGKEGWSGKTADYSEGYMISMMDVNNDAKARFASWLFMRYFEQPESVMAYTTSGAFLPYLKSVGESAEWQEKAGTAQVAGVAQMDSFYTYYGFDGASALRADTQLAIQNIVDNGADVADTLTGLAGQYQK